MFSAFLHLGVEQVMGCIIDMERIDLDIFNYKLLQKEFIAFDIETTGLSPIRDRIIELGAVLFNNGKKVKTFSSLVNCGVDISNDAESVNGITKEMIKNAPNEYEVFSNLIKFLGEAMQGKIIMCAHNASFDFGFLYNTFLRLGMKSDIKYVDTLSLSRKYIKDVENYQQRTLEEYLGLKNEMAHRAVYDAENCGEILSFILEKTNDEFEAETIKYQKSIPLENELEVCAFIQNCIASKGADINNLRFIRVSNNYVNAMCLYSFLTFKFSNKGNYIVVKSDYTSNLKLPIESAIEREGGTGYTRVYFSSPFDLEPLSLYFYDSFMSCYNSMMEYISLNDNRLKEVQKYIIMMTSISKEKVNSILDNVKHKNYAPLEVKLTPKITRDLVKICGVDERTPIDKIKNRYDRYKGYDEGSEYWYQGEIERKKGNYEKALALFDKARYFGYLYPVLYNSYAITYRQMKDYCNEIAVLDEAISVLPDVGFQTRQDKAIQLLYAKQEKERISEEKLKAKISKKPIENKATKTKEKRGRAIIKMTDDGTVLAEYETVTAASNENCISPKSIRDAAKGVQKHAGGFCWKYKD